MGKDYCQLFKSVAMGLFSKRKSKKKLGGKTKFIANLTVTYDNVPLKNVSVKVYHFGRNKNEAREDLKRRIHFKLGGIKEVKE